MNKLICGKFVVGTAMGYQSISKEQGDLAASMKEQQLLAELDRFKHMSRAKDQHISMLEEQLKSKQMIVQQKSKWKN